MKEVEKILDAVEKDKNVLAVIMFGSALGGEGRDVDICLVADEGVGDLSTMLMYYSGRFCGKIDLSVFQMLPLYIRRNVLKGKILFCRDYEKLYNIVFATIKEFGFYEKLYKMCLEGVNG